MILLTCTRAVPRNHDIGFLFEAFISAYSVLTLCEPTSEMLIY